MASDPRYLFVYGTLRRGSRSLGDWRKKFGAAFVGHGTIGAELYHIGRYPGALPSNRSKTRGEVYSLGRPQAALKALDEYEGYDANEKEESLFVRHPVKVWLETGKTIRAWVYFFNGKTSKSQKISSWEYRRGPDKKPKAA